MPGSRERIRACPDGIIISGRVGSGGVSASGGQIWLLCVGGISDRVLM